MSFEYRGLWWLPSAPNKKISGTLSFSKEDGAYLDLDGAFKDINELPSFSHFEIILGTTLNGKKITLYRCYEVRSDISATLRSLFSASYLFVGHHFLADDQINFSRIFVNYSYLVEWVNKNGFMFNLKDEFAIKYREPENLVYDINDEFQLSLDFKGIISPSTFWNKEASIKQETRIVFSPKNEDKHFSTFLEKIYLFQNFLNLAVLEPILPIELKGEIEDIKIEFPNGLTFPQPIEIYRKIDPFVEKKTLHPSKFLFLFPDIENSFQTYLHNWFNKRDLKPVIDLYISLYYNPYMYMQTKFINSILALEVYHRRTRKNIVLPKKEYKELCKIILECIPEGHRERMARKLMYSNEPSLRDRLYELALELNDVSCNIIKDVDGFISDIIHMRNYLIHYDKKKKDKITKGIDLYILTRKIMTLVHICLLKEVGIDEKAIKAMIEKNDKLTLKYLL